MNSDSKITVLFCYRDKEIERVKRSLTSLSNQTNQNFTVLFIDYGSEIIYSNEIKRLISDEFPSVKYVYNHTIGMPWNRAHALNCGIKLAETPYVFTSDIDIAFREDSIELLYGLLRNDTVYYFPTYLVSRNFKDWDNFGKYKNFDRSGERGRGLSLMPTQAIQKIRGYDEFFCFWGYEDNNLYHKLKLLGLKSTFWDQDCFLYHQWHPFYPDAHQRFPKGWRGFMKSYHQNSQHEDVRINNQDRSWGTLFKETDRPTLNSGEPVNEVPLEGDPLFISYTLNRVFNLQKFDNHLKFFFEEATYPQYIKTKTVRLINWVNGTIFNAKWIPFELKSKYDHLNLSLYDIRDVFIFFIYAHKNSIEDYCISIDGGKGKIELILKKAVR